MVSGKNPLQRVVTLLWGSFLLFSMLFIYRSGVIPLKNPSLSTLTFHPPIKDGMTHETWMNVYQHRQKIGIYHATFQKNDTFYKIHEKYKLRFNLLGLVTDILVETKGVLKSDFSLSSFDMTLSSGRFNYTAEGMLVKNKLVVKAGTLGSYQRLTLPMKDKLYLSSGLSSALAHARLSKEDELIGYLFDASTLSKSAFRVRRVQAPFDASEFPNIDIRNDNVAAYKIEWNGLSQYAWILDNGEILKEEGLMGLSMKKTTRDEALSTAIVEKGEDLALSASILSPEAIDNPSDLNTLELTIAGVDLSRFSVSGGRQTRTHQRITVTKEILPTDPPDRKTASLNIDNTWAPFLSPTPFIQSTHPKIRSKVRAIIDDKSSDLEKGRQLIQWIYENIEKRPVISLPNALSTLTHKMGDCNEHAVLLAAMTRAAGIPSKIETGIVYLNGRFFYHAWNLIYVGKWVTADAVFNQFPADVTHIRFSDGHDSVQLDILGIIGKIRITDVQYD